LVGSNLVGFLSLLDELLADSPDVFLGEEK
jgi:hypothetical protein